MFLIDTNVISEARKGSRANPGVRAFFVAASEQDQPLFVTSITIGELRRGVDLILRRGDRAQADALEHWLAVLLEAYGDRVLALDAEAAQLWGQLRVPHPEHALDKQIAAIALLHDLTVVTGNTGDFLATGVALLNPFHSPTEQTP
ncbi:MAG: type II toxin-antitoxin system VapC family toxin [Cyanobacteria bacterium K_Offshore_surface_m2_239]|nr:type II toxin-antitoxin system VapC family toxin [Cyanobacteria bacterium K_Offshore_surface_m2_239]